MDTTRSSLGIGILLIAMAGLAALLALSLLGSVGGTITIAPAQKAVNTATGPHWLGKERISLQADWKVSTHATKHEGEDLDAEKIYNMILQGKCAGVGQFCNSQGKQLLLCFDPITGLLGGIFVNTVTGLVESGWGVTRFHYWGDKVRGPEAPYQPGLCK